MLGVLLVSEIESMNRIDFIKTETAFADRWVQRLIDSFDPSQWLETPPVLKTNVNWQLGHLLVSKYFHSIVSITPDRPDLSPYFSMRQYRSFYARGTQPETLTEAPSPEKLLADFKVIQTEAISVLESLTDEMLDQPTEMENPVAKTKYEALTWSFKHHMWHGGQLSTLKRVLKEQ